MQRLRVLSGMLFFLLIVGMFLPLHAGAARYVDNGDLTVSDTMTGLIWQQNNNDTTYTWAKALTYCEGLSLAGKTDWRLPNYKELETIVDFTRYNPALDPVFGGYDSGYPYYWSGTSFAHNTGSAWFVDFNFGSTYHDDKSLNCYVRCVRGGPWAVGTLTLSKTGPGTGNVVSAPAGIDCGQDCTQEYAPGTNVTLTATADAGSVFSGWSGGGCTGTGQCVAAVNGDLTITAEFAKPSYSISGTVKTGSGSPVASVSMALSGASSGTATTDAGGLYGFSGLYNGVYTITPSKSRFTFSPSNRSVNVNENNVAGQDFEAAQLPPSADFAGAPLSGVAPLQVKFTDRSTGAPGSWYWTFGDGGNGAEQNPSHTYQTPGSYTVSLTATGPGGSDTETKTAYITVTEPPPKAGFSGTPLTGPWPLTVQFASSSTGAIATYAWDFGDGRASSERNPAYTYTSAGVYTVKLKVTGSGGSDTETKPNYITVTEQAPKADFTADPTSGPKPLKVSFTNKSTGNISSCKWEFGDGIISYEQNPVYTYSVSGTYTAALTVAGPGGTSSKSVKINVTDGSPVAGFTFSPASGTAPLEVKFTDTSTGNITSWAWTFGDGGAGSEHSPTHTYKEAGTFTAALTVSGSGGSSSKSATIKVKAPPVVASFTASPTSGPAPLDVKFTDTSTGSITSWSWTFGDGGASSEQSPAYTYKGAGTFKVTLTVSGSGVSSSKSATIKALPPSSYKASGRITTKKGEPFPKVLITFTTETGSAPKSVEVGEDGRWSQTGFLQGVTYRIIPRLQGYTFTPALRSVSKARNNLDFAVSGFRVSGKVSTPGGSAIGNTMITFSRASGSGAVPSAVLTDARGNWSQTGFQPGTIYRASPTKRKYNFDPLMIQFNGPTGNLDFEGVMKQ